MSGATGRDVLAACAYSICPLAKLSMIGRELPDRHVVIGRRQHWQYHRTLARDVPLAAGIADGQVA